MNLNKNIFTNIFLICVAFSGLSKCRTKLDLVKKRDVSLRNISSDYQPFLDLLKPITVKRVSGTPEIKVVENYIVSKMKNYGWHVDLDKFTDNTPFGPKPFTNIIATYQIGKNLANLPPTQNMQQLYETKNRVVFACHYDSKYFRDIEFVAATDSAVPCAMLIDLAKFLNEHFSKSQFSNLNRHIQFIFFDGEEAFVDWTSTDSLYGSRNYAKVLKQKYQKNGFDSMELFVLLDLIGADSSSFLNYFPTETGHIYKHLANIENYLIKMGKLNKKSPFYFRDSQGFGKFQQVEDDHKPFLKEGVPILHMIPSPFPNQWHTVKDDLANLNPKNIQDIRMILKYFLLNILNSDSSNSESKPKKHLPDDEF